MKRWMCIQDDTAVLITGDSDHIDEIIKQIKLQSKSRYIRRGSTDIVMDVRTALDVGKIINQKQNKIKILTRLTSQVDGGAWSSLSDSDCTTQP